MTVVTEGNQPQTEGAPEGIQLNPAEVAAVEKAKTGLSPVDPLNPPAPTSAVQRPDSVPEKFWDAVKGVVNTDALLKSYGELEKGRSGAQAETPAEETPAEVPADGKIVKEEPKVEAEAPPLADVISTFRTEWETSGDVSGETADKLEAAGISKEMQSIYLAGIQALQSKAQTEAHGFVGGEQNYADMVAWAAKTLGDAEIDAFNASLDNPALRETAIRGLHAKFSQAVPSEGKMIGKTTTASSGEVYTNRDQLLADQKDARYGSDPVFRQGVVEKLQRSQAAGSMGPVVDAGWTARMQLGR